MANVERSAWEQRNAANEQRAAGIETLAREQRFICNPARTANASPEITFTRNVFRLTFAPNQNVFIFPVNAVRLGRHSGFLALPVPVVIATIVSSSIARILQSAIDVF